MLNLIWRDSAALAVEAIVDYISEHNLDAALRLRNSITECAERVTTHPFMYRRGRASGTREAVITPNYLLIYRITTEAVEIITVIHTRREYP